MGALHKTSEKALGCEVSSLTLEEEEVWRDQQRQIRQFRQEQLERERDLQQVIK